MVASSDDQAQGKAHAFIRERILDGVYVGGTWLKPQEIADELNISRMPVREALRGLEVEGLVTMRPNRGAVVTELAVADVEDLFEMRAYLESVTAQAAVEALTKENEQTLRRLHAEMDGQRADVKNWLVAHNEFHDFISSLSGRRRLVQEIQRSRTIVQPYIRLYIDVYRTPELPAFEHTELVEALLSRDKPTIHRTFRSHVMATKERVVSFLTRHYEYRKKSASRRAA